MSKLKVIMTYGLSGSGKTTWADEWIKENPNTVKVCKDDIRYSMGADYGKNIKVKESKVIEKRNELIMDALKKRKNVIVADTNLIGKVNHIENVKALVFPKYRNEYDFEIKDFTDVPVDVCIERCANRPEGRDFWKKVIMGQKNQFLKPPIIVQDESLPKCVISDHDGTIAHVSPNRSPYTGVGSEADERNEIVCEYLKLMKAQGYTIFILSGLEDTYMEHRKNWLNANGVEYDYLYMRKGGDSRKDCVIKDELFKEHIEGKYFVHAILDDRNQMLRYWIDKGYMNRLFSIGNPFHEF